MIGLSATLDNPEKFAYWLENRGETNLSDKIVYLTSKQDRAVPLIHYSFITVTQSIFKSIKDKSVHEEIKSNIDKPFIIKDSKGNFNDDNYLKINKMVKLFETKEIRVKKANILNKVMKYLTDHEMTPAICYIFSIKQIENCSKEITTNLLEFDSKVPYIAKRECEQILRNKLPNFEEYLHLPEYLNLVALLEKGIATHHSKMLPVLREIVEIFFSRGFIKLLFATESVAIGLNLPVKTCIFTDIYKHDGNVLRILQSHEYTQSAGRAGRLGLDVVGHVIHLNNLFRTSDTVSYKKMMNGQPQSLTSKFKISFNLLLNLLETGDNNLVKFASRSMITGDLNNQMNQINCTISKIKDELNNIKIVNTPINILEQFSNLQKNIKISVNKKRKEIERQLVQIHYDYKFVEHDNLKYTTKLIKQNELDELQKQFDCMNTYIKTNVETVLTVLKNEQFIYCDLNDEQNIKLTLKGKIASQIREVHCLIFAKLLEDKTIDNLTAKQLVSLFSIFTNITVQEDFKDHKPNADDTEVQKMVDLLTEMYFEYKNKKFMHNIYTGIDYTIHYDLLNYIDEWCNCENVESCRVLLKKIGQEKEIFLGEFVKALLKINNISSEMEKIAELTGNISFLSKIKKIPNMTLKYVVTNQSLYI